MPNMLQMWEGSLAKPHAVDGVAAFRTQVLVVCLGTCIIGIPISQKHLERMMIKVCSFD